MYARFNSCKIRYRYHNSYYYTPTFLLCEHIDCNDIYNVMLYSKHFNDDVEVKIVRYSGKIVTVDTYVIIEKFINERKLREDDIYAVFMDNTIGDNLMKFYILLSSTVEYIFTNNLVFV